MVLLSLAATAAWAQTPTPDPAPVPPAPASPPPPTAAPSDQAPTKTTPAKKKRAKTLRRQPAYTVPFHAPFAEMGPASAVQQLPLRAGRLVGVSLRAQQPEVNTVRTALVPLLVLCAVALLFIPLALAPVLGRTSIHALQNRGDLALGGLVVLLGVTVGILAVLVAN